MMSHEEVAVRSSDAVQSIAWSCVGSGYVARGGARWIAARRFESYGKYVERPREWRAPDSVVQREGVWWWGAGGPQRKRRHGRTLRSPHGFLELGREYECSSRGSDSYAIA